MTANTATLVIAFYIGVIVISEGSKTSTSIYMNMIGDVALQSSNITQDVNASSFLTCSYKCLLTEGCCVSSFLPDFICRIATLVSCDFSLSACIGAVTTLDQTKYNRTTNILHGSLSTANGHDDSTMTQWKYNTTMNKMNVDLTVVQDSSMTTVQKNVDTTSTELADFTTTGLRQDRTTTAELADFMTTSQRHDGTTTDELPDITTSIPTHDDTPTTGLADVTTTVLGNDDTTTTALADVTTTVLGNDDTTTTGLADVTTTVLGNDDTTIEDTTIVKGNSVRTTVLDSYGTTTVRELLSTTAVLEHHSPTIKEYTTKATACSNMLSRYIFQITEATMTEAQNVCGEFGGKIAEIETEEEALCLSDLFVLYDQSWYWIGGYNYNADDIYEWWNSTIPMTYTNWKRNNPTKVSTYLCVYATSSSDFQWATDECVSKYPYICEIELINK